MQKVKITVIKKAFYSELAECYLTDGQDARCSLVNEGDVFVYNGGAEMPKGLCPWAWIDLYSSINALSAGATCTPWQKRDGMSIVCCRDGVRPVSFLLEAIDE